MESDCDPLFVGNYGQSLQGALGSELFMSIA